MRKLTLVFMLLVGGAAAAQTPAKQTTQLGQAWLGYFNQTRFSDKWGLWMDLHLRTKEEVVSGLSVGIVRTGLTYYLADNTKLTAAYAFVNFFPADNHRNISQPEHRPWQQIQWHTKYSRLRTMQWLRFEQRFRRKILNDDALAEGYNFNYRLRYNLLFSYPFSKQGFAPRTWSGVVSSEVFLNFGKEITYNYFDQNRFFAGFAYQLNSHDNLQIGYMNVFQQLAAGNRYRSTHTVRVFYFHNIDWRSKNE
jgi:hypothetical protein